MDRIDQLLRRTRHSLMSMDNVVGVGKGFKMVRGEKTKEPSVVVLVSRKLPPSELRRGEKIPNRIMEVATDVIEVGEIRLLGRTDYLRPAPPGVSIGHYKISAGTFGAVVKDKATKKPLILSNNHVLANCSDGKDGRCQIGDPIYQPGPHDGGKKEHLIGYLERFVPIYREYSHSECPQAAAVERLGNMLIQTVRPNYRMTLLKRTAADNYVDAAVARPISEDVISPHILDIGPIQGVREAKLGMKIKKSGRSSGYNESTIQVVATTLRVSLGNNENVYFTDQLVAGQMASPGDSGSVVLDEDNNVVGLLFAGSDKTTVINRIQNVMELLQIEF